MQGWWALPPPTYKGAAGMEVPSLSIQSDHRDWDDGLGQWPLLRTGPRDPPAATPAPSRRLPRLPAPPPGAVLSSPSTDAPHTASRKSEPVTGLPWRQVAGLTASQLPLESRSTRWIRRSRRSLDRACARQQELRPRSDHTAGLLTALLWQRSPRLSDRTRTTWGAVYPTWSSGRRSRRWR